MGGATLGPVSEYTNPEEAPPEAAYDSQIAHTIWELERAVKKGRVSEATRRVLLESHVHQLQMIEERVGVPPEQRSFLLLQKRPGPGILLLPGESESCDSLRSVARYFHRAGLNVLCSSLSYRILDVSGQSPTFWQTCIDEARNRYDMLCHCSNRLSILGVGMSAAVALELASSVRFQSMLALFPVFHADVALSERLKNVARKVFPAWVKSRPDWSSQREMLTSVARRKARKSSLPLYVVAEERKDRTEAGRSARFSESLTANAAKVRLVPATQATSPSKLPEAVLEELTKFVRQN